MGIYKKMRVFREKINLENALIILYFLSGLIEIVSQLSMDNCYQYVVKPLQIVLLVVLYWYSSTQKNPLYFINISFLLIGRLFFISTDLNMVLCALVAVFFHRIIEIYYVSKLIKLQDYIPVILGSIPFLFYFLYLVSIPESILIESYVVLIAQIILISILSGIILSHYLLTFNRKDIWLVVFGIMSLMQTFVIFIEKFYLPDFNLFSLRPMALFLNTMVCFSFYKFVITAERLNND